MIMFNITDGNNNISRHKPVEHINVVIGLHVSAHARPQTWPGAFAQMSARFHPRYACTRAQYGG